VSISLATRLGATTYPTSRNNEPQGIVYYPDLFMHIWS
jgi:hypothetical protein